MKIFRLSIFLLFALILSACSFSLAEDVTPPPGYRPPVSEETQPAPISGPLYPLVPPNPANGASIYAEKCAPCHGDTGQGDGPRAAELPNPVAALAAPEVARDATPAGWYRMVTEGNLEKFMPPFSSLSDRERWDVVAYSFSLGTTEEEIAQAGDLYAANCASCHGETGRGDGPEAQDLAAAPPDFTDLKYMADRSSAGFYEAITAGSSPAMPAFDGELSEAQRWSLAAYVRSLAFTAGSEPAAAVTPAPETEAAAQVTPEEGGTPVSQVVETETVTGTLGVGSIVGRIVYGSSGGQLPDDMNVTLHGFDDMNVVITRTATVDAEGAYVFDEVEMPEGRVFLTTVEYEGATYGSDIVMAQADSPILNLPIEVFETTTDTSVLSGDRMHMFFEFAGEQTLRVIELFILSNTSDKTLVPAEEGEPTLVFDLPEGATNLEFQDGAMGGRFVETPNGFGDTAVIRPGQGNYQVLFAFEMPYDNKLELAQPINVPLNAVVVLVPEGTINLKGENLQDAGVRDVQGTQYRMYNLAALGPDSELRLSITGRPGGTSPVVSVGSNETLVIGLAALGLVLIGAGIFLYTRSRTVPEVEYDPEDEVEEASSEKAETIMDAILALDDLYQSGELPEEAYHQRRAELKARLQSLIG